MILNLPFIRDQRQELKAGVWGFQKNLQDGGGEAERPQALKGSKQTSEASPDPQGMHPWPMMLGVLGWVLSFLGTALGRFLWA